MWILWKICRDVYTEIALLTTFFVSCRCWFVAESGNVGFLKINLSWSKIKESTLSNRKKSIHIPLWSHAKKQTSKATTWTYQSDEGDFLYNNVLLSVVLKSLKLKTFVVDNTKLDHTFNIMISFIKIGLNINGVFIVCLWKLLQVDQGLGKTSFSVFLS